MGGSSVWSVQTKLISIHGNVKTGYGFSLLFSYVILVVKVLICSLYLLLKYTGLRDEL